MYEEKTQKDTLAERISEMFGIRKEYDTKHVEIMSSGDYTDQYKEKLRLKLADDYNAKLGRSTRTIIATLDGVLVKVGAERKKAMAKRNDQAYNLQFQNALHTLELAGNELSEQETLDLIQPFATDSISMAALRAAAVRGGMNREIASMHIAYRDNPVFGVLEGLKKLLNRYAETGIDKEEDYFSIEHAVYSLVDMLTDNLENKRQG